MAAKVPAIASVFQPKRRKKGAKKGASSLKDMSQKLHILLNCLHLINQNLVQPKLTARKTGNYSLFSL